MRKLQVDLAELTYAFEDASWMANYYLDLETGQVVMIRAEIRWSEALKSAAKGSTWR
jgi:hypothetical protein